MDRTKPLVRSWGRLLLAGFLAHTAQGLEIGEEARVKADRVNLRARPGLNYEVVLQVNFGDVLTVAELEGEEWIGVAPPRNAHAWVHRDFVKDGKVAPARLNARSGPGINYSVMGRLGRGADIVPVEEFGDWIKIVAPENARLWVHRDYLESAAPPVAPATPATGPDAGWVTLPAGTPATAAAPQVVSITPAASGGLHISNQGGGAMPYPEPDERGDDVDAALPYPPPEGLELVPLSGQGQGVTYEGDLTRVKYLIGRPSRYELVVERNGRPTTVCYVRGNRDQLSGFVGRRMRISGKAYWVQDLKFPVVVPDRIHLDPPPAAAP
jgi:SH3-like domain-containing protein